jgi:hypothetical protein
MERRRRASVTRARVRAEAAVFVRAAYRGLLDREPDDAGLKTWVQFLQHGGHIDDMVERIGRSEEFRRRSESLGVLSLPSLSVAAKFEELIRRPKEERRLVILGNCQARQMATAVQAITTLPRPFAMYAGPELWPEVSSGALDLSALFHAHDTVWVQSELWLKIAKRYDEYRSKVMLFPPIRFSGFHPDLVYLVDHDVPCVIDGPADGYHSSIGLLAWKAGLTPAQACELFRDDVFFDKLGFDHWWWFSWTWLMESGKLCGIDMAPMLDSWIRGGCFMHTTNHPKMHVTADVARALLARMPDVRLRPGRPEHFAHDHFRSGPIWPIYPGVARRLGLGEGSYDFHLGTSTFCVDAPVEVIGLSEFLEGSFAGLTRHVRQTTKLDCLEWPRYKALFDEIRPR